MLLHVNFMQTFLLFLFFSSYASLDHNPLFPALAHKSQEDVSTKDGRRDIFIKIMIMQ